MSRRDETLLDLSLSRASVDRSAHVRGDEEFLSTALADPGTRILTLHEGRTPWVPRADTATAGPSSALCLRPPDPSDVQRDPWFLGRLGGTAYFAVTVADAQGEGRQGARWGSLREIGANLDDDEAGLLTTATALAGWHRTADHCPRCGSATRVVHGGWARRCPEDGSEHYPRTDPAVIMAVTDPSDRLLLGTGLPWPDGRVSVLAGFVEAGETLEAAVAREVMEEVGIAVDAIVYRGNQPWPFPASLMLGFRASARQTELIVDPTELRFAAWFSRPELARGVEAGTLTLPARLSIARALIEEWFGEPIHVPGEDE
ncbi:NAD(+) diphosphatase [Ornithinimicrobium panacihumi]|uniref:NAD(+) diphosphatase n=1 Tax=Ornithinimicrobium panacihumi TaxID=2008449 RepID=UPI003F8A0A95